MKILKSEQIREVDAFTIENEPILSIDLMERAAMNVSNWIKENISKDNTIKIFVGPGNNGGDGLVVARQILNFGFKVEVWLLKISGHLSADCQINLERLLKNGNVKINEINSINEFPEINEKDILVDALFGSGLSRPLEGLPKELVLYLNSSLADIVAIDIPSGLFGENNAENDIEAIVKAKHTLTFQLPKLSFFFKENEAFVGNWHVLPIGLNQGFIDSLDSEYGMLEPNFIKSRIINRTKFSHKGSYGHNLIIAGSYGKMGAAILAAKACLRTGSGLVTVHVPKIGYGIMQTALPEAMISIDQSDLIFTSIADFGNYSAVGIGPGIGMKQNTKKALANLLSAMSSPMVIDADALNIISDQKELLKSVPENSILTPHPKEFERLAGSVSSHYERVQAQIDFSKEYKVIIVLKGAHTTITSPDGKCYFNSSGNPGMATAGSGDVLTGVILSLLGQSYDPFDAAIIGVFLHGLAGDIASEKIGEEALIASDIIENLGFAYLRIK